MPEGLGFGVSFGPALFGQSGRSVFQDLPLRPVVPESELPPPAVRAAAIAEALRFLPTEQQAAAFEDLEQRFPGQVPDISPPAPTPSPPPAMPPQPPGRGPTAELPQPTLPPRLIFEGFFGEGRAEQVFQRGLQRALELFTVDREQARLIFEREMAEEREREGEKCSLFELMETGRCQPRDPPPVIPPGTAIFGRGQTFLLPTIGKKVAEEAMKQAAKRGLFGRILRRILGRAPVEIEIPAIPELFPVRLPTKRRRVAPPIPVELPPQRRVEPRTRPETRPTIPTGPIVVPGTAPTIPRPTLPAPTRPARAPTRPARPTRAPTRVGQVAQIAVGVITGAGLAAIARARVRPRLRDESGEAPLAPPAPPSPPIAPPAPPTLGVPTALAQGLGLRVRREDCVEVKRRRRRKGKCKEGFFREFPGKTQFITWRETDCAELTVRQIRGLI